MKLVYPVIITLCKDMSSYKVEVPDLPGCITVGSSLVEAILMGTEAISDWIIKKIEEGMDYPMPSDYAEVTCPQGSFVNLLVVDIDDYQNRYDTGITGKPICIVEEKHNYYDALKPLPIGLSDYKRAVTEYYYVDKTLLIKEFLDAIPQVSLFTRPRRFGKTLNMDMLRTFFEISKEDTSVYFQDKKIWTCGEKYRKHQGIYPVIYLTFKDVKYRTWKDAFRFLQMIIAGEYARHGELESSDQCGINEIDYYRKVRDEEAGEVELSRALANLSFMLHKHYGVAPIIIIDEYDTPIQQGYLHGYYDLVVSFIRNLFSGVFKDNPHLSYGFLTGILRVAKESIFSGMNNLFVYSVLEDKYSEHFGFTTDEIREMTEYYGIEDKFDQICEWYDGYHFGETDIFNPWSVLNYIAHGCKVNTYWQSTGDNSIIHQIIDAASDETLNHMQLLVQGKTISSYVDMSVIYPEIEKNPYTIYSFLLSAGYLKSVFTEDVYDGNHVCEIAIPNKEISCIYEREILNAYANHINQSTSIALRRALIRQDMDEFEKHLQKFLVDTISSFDYTQENFYHGLMLGIYAVMNREYRVTSNRESGFGRYDIQMKPMKKGLPGVLIELKVPKENIPDGKIEEKLEELCQEGLKQIEQKNYINEMRAEGISNLMKIGIAFYKKQVRLDYVMEE